MLFSTLKALFYWGFAWLFLWFFVSLSIDNQINNKIMSQNAQTKNMGKDVKNLASVKVVETPKTTEELKKPIISETEKNKAAEQIIKILHPTAEQRLKSLEQFQILGEKFNFLKSKQDELEKFTLSSDGTKEKISLSNASGFRFEVTNSQTIEKVLEVISADLKIFTERANKEVLSFEI